MLKKSGYLGYIVPTTLLNNVYAQNLRSWLMARCRIEHISVARERVFAAADVHTSVVVLREEGNATFRSEYDVLTTAELSKSFTEKPTTFSQIKQGYFKALAGQVWNILINDENAELITRLTTQYSALKDVSAINRGLITGAKDEFFTAEKKSEAEVPIIAGSDVQRYFSVPPSQFVLFQRPASAGGCWDPAVHFAPHKIVVRQICRKPTASLLNEPLAVTGNIFTVRSDSSRTECYLLGIINSHLIAYFWNIMFSDFKTSFPQVTIFSLSQIPIPRINLDDAADKARHDRMVDLVEAMLSLHKQLPNAAPTTRTVLQRQIDATDRQIDRLVYELYGLTETEIALVEEGTNK